MAMWPKLSEMSSTELEEMAKAIKAEQDKRDDERFIVLCKEAINEHNANLKTEAEAKRQAEANRILAESLTDEILAQMYYEK